MKQVTESLGVVRYDFGLCLNCRLEDVTLVATKRKPFDVLAEGIMSKK